VDKNGRITQTSPVKPENQAPKTKNQKIMFQVTLDGVFAIYLVIILCSVFFSWLAAAVFQAGRASLRKKNFVICGICDHVYEDLTENEITECPRCGARNERAKILDI
jgi:hypothetical protein